MTTERAVRPAAVVQAAAAGYARRAQALAPETSAAPAPVSATVLGIPEAEFTARVRQAVARLLGDIDALRGELGFLRSKLEDVERIADQDQLLPVLNRRAFMRELSRHIAYVGRYRVPASLVYFDLDDFKRINDTYGHAGGDAVLAHFSEMLSTHVRESDVVGRIGGDEFAVILTHVGLEQAQRKATALLDALGTYALGNGETIPPIGFSYGVIELMPGESAETALSRADSEMYDKKRRR